MSYSPMLSEMDEETLLAELAQRWQNRAQGLCDWCEEPTDSDPACRFPGRHDGHRATYDANPIATDRQPNANERLRAQWVADYKNAVVPDQRTTERYAMALEAELDDLKFQLRNIFLTDDPTEIHKRVQYVEQQWMKALGET